MKNTLNHCLSEKWKIKNNSTCLTPGRLVYFEEDENDQHLSWMWRNRNNQALLLKMMGSTILEIKIKHWVPCDTNIPLLSIYIKDKKNLLRKDIHMPMYSAALFTRVKIWKQKCPGTEDWIKKTGLYT